jgi:hypothetical protein
MKKLLLFLLLLPALAWGGEPIEIARMNPYILGSGVSAAAASAMKQKLITSKYSAISVAATRYLPLVGINFLAAEAYQKQMMPTSGTLRNLRVVLDGSPDNGAGTQSYTITVRKNGSDVTGFACTISETETSCQDAGPASPMTVVKGDLVNYSVAFANTPTSRSISTMIEFQGDSANQVILLGSYQEALRADATNRYGPIHGHYVHATEAVARGVLPVAGTITGFYVNLVGAPGTDNTRTFKIFKNGVAEASSVIEYGAAESGLKEVTGLSITSNGTSDVFSVELDATEGGTLGSTDSAQWSVLFAPTTNGEFPILAGGTSSNLATGATKYIGQSSSLMAYTDAAGTQQSIGNDDYTIKGMCVVLGTAPGTGKSSVYTPQTSSGDAANPAAVTISGASTSGCSTGDLTPTADEFYGTKLVNTDGAATVLSIGYRAYIAP